MKKNQKTLVWQFYTEGSKNRPNYLLGTMHVAHEAAFQWEEKMKAAILACDIYAAEFNLDEIDQNALQQAMLLPDDLGLSQILSKKLYAKTAKVLEKLTSQPMAIYEHFKPIIFSKLFSETALPNERGLALDENLLEYARRNGKILRGCETFAEQLAVMHKIPIEAQIKQLKDMVSNVSRMNKEYGKMAKWYVQADIDKLYTAAKRSVRGTKKLMLTDRNALMIERILEMATTETTVCAAVGAGHLWGKNGIIVGLKKGGFIVKPVV